MAFILPSNAELNEIQQDLLPTLTNGRRIFDLMPMRDYDAAQVEWDQKDNYTGLQQIRGIGGAPGRVNKIAWRRYQMLPGYYGEFVRFEENELTQLRAPGTWNVPIDLTSLVMDAQQYLLQRRLDRIELIGWSALQGSISVAKDNVIMQTDTFAVQSYSAAVAWGTAATATPLNDFRQVQLKHRGHSVTFGASAVAIMNQQTANDLLNNTNNADLYGRRVTGLATANSIPQVNQILTADNLPTIEIYDQGYEADPGTWQGAGTIAAGSLSSQNIYSPGATLTVGMTVELNKGGSDYEIVTLTAVGSATNNVYPCSFVTVNAHTLPVVVSGIYSMFIPYRTVIVVGQRLNGVPVMEYQMTRNTQNPGFAPGPYMLVVDNLTQNGKVPRTVEVHDGHNGGPAIQYPSSIVVMSV